MISPSDFVPYLTSLLASEMMNPVGQILYGTNHLLVLIFNSIGYRSLAVIRENEELRSSHMSRANLLFVNVLIMNVCVILSLFVLPFCAIIGIVATLVIYVFPVFRKKVDSVLSSADQESNV